MEHIIFAPASNPKLTKPEDIYLICGKHPHPGYERSSGKATNDVCVLYVWPWPINDVPIYQALSPLKLAVKSFFNKEDGWKVIGYPSDENACMYIIEGNYLPQHMITDRGAIATFGCMTILMDTQSKGGMSGGPWIHCSMHHDEFVVNGIQSHVSFLHSQKFPSVSISPHFSKEMLEKLGLEIHYDLDT